MAGSGGTVTFDPAGRSVDEILDYGAVGLEYWERFLPLYERAFGALPGVGTRELQARYDEQRGLDIGKLDAARNALADAVIGAERQWMAQLGVARRLPDIWAGRGGAAAREVVDGQQWRARGDLDIARAVVAAIDGVLDPLRQAVFTKAVRTVGLLERRGDDSTAVAIGGKSPGDIEAMLDARTTPPPTGCVPPSNRMWSANTPSSRPCARISTISSSTTIAPSRPPWRRSWTAPTRALSHLSSRRCPRTKPEQRHRNP